MRRLVIGLESNKTNSSGAEGACSGFSDQKKKECTSENSREY